ncbi:hypothetical protein R1sor_007437 [Riccia sorocarpa]|uniref:Reverse transcriptase domain-containing protein n=1 Tax=Riccia sorocarpa TaxID=122646 RepID=A0ABD3HSM6_9MARC
MERWLEWIAVKRFNLSIVQLRVINRQLFLLVMKNQDQRDKLLSLPDLSLDGFPVTFNPWTIDFNLKNQNVRRVATWVELPGIDPVVEHLGNRMLSILGQPTFRTVSKGVNRYSNMRGCVMMEAGAERHPKLVFQLPWGGVIAQEVKYHDVPNFCFNCKRLFSKTEDEGIGEGNQTTGKSAKATPHSHPGSASNPTTNPGSSSKKQPDEDFTEVKSKKGGKARGSAGRQPPSAIGANPFDVLGDNSTAGTQESPGIPCQSGPSSPSPEQGHHDSSQDHIQDSQSPQSKNPVAIDPDPNWGTPQKLWETPRDPTLAAPTNGEHLGDWADVEDEDVILSEARGSKGRPEEVKDHTPDRGNVSKRRPISRSPRWDFQPQTGEQGNTLPFMITDGVQEAEIPNTSELDPGDGTPGALGNVLGPDLEILTRLEDRALGPTEFIEEGNWIVCGDFNQVDRVRDSVGPSPRIHGSEERIWSRLVMSKALADCYFEAATRSGPRFTKQAKAGRRLDRSRLDRVYLTDGGKWLAHIAEIQHYGGHIVGDHIPVRSKLILQARPEEQGQRKFSYFKLNANVLKQPEAREEVKRIWQDHAPEVTDARSRWSQGWARIRKFCRELQLTQRNQNRINQLRQEVEERRRFLPLDCTEEEITELTEVEESRHALEDEEANKWFLRSRSKTLREGEAPTKFFFELAKARFKKDRIRALKTGAGATVTGNEEILKVVEDFYSDLYNSEGESLESRLERQEVLQLIDRRISVEDSLQVDSIPTMEEIDLTVKSLKRGKSPGLDGVTSDMIQECWEFIKQDCYEMIWAFWDKKALLQKDSQGCIKLIAKNEDKQWIKNWRPITLMSCTYKIIGKLIANRLKPLLPHLVDEEQTGFIPGRHIDDNILTLRLAEEWGKVSGESNLFVKLDFTKAFDRVSFTFLWHTLRAMGFSEATISRIRGLTAGGTSKVHINQAFTAPIKIKRGVRQGCPLVPLLFALSTQPLMQILRKQEQRGLLRGLQLPGLRSILHELFADDTSLFIKATANDFQRARACIGKFETASGALLNVQKSMVLAVGPTRDLGWLRASGYEVAGLSHRFKFLGIWSGRGITQLEITEKIVGSTERKFNLWANR